MMKRNELRVGNMYIVAPPAIRLDDDIPSPHLRRVVVVDTEPWEYDEHRVPRPSPKGTGVLVAEFSQDGGAERLVLPIGQFRMEEQQYLAMRYELQEQAKREGRQRKMSEQELRARFEDLAAEATLDGEAFGEYDGDTRRDGDGKHWFETRRGIVGMSLDTFARVVEGS